MKKQIFITLLASVLMIGCNDDSGLFNMILDNESRISRLEQLCQEINANVSSLQTIVSAQQSGDYVTSVAPVVIGSKQVGNTVTFAKYGTITIYNGTDGKSPLISVAKYTDDAYYWTLDGTWLLDGGGNKIKASGDSGNNGVTPQLKIDGDYWYVSYDEGSSWTQLGKATGADGKDGDSMFKSVTYDEDYVYFTLADDTELNIPRKGTSTSIYKSGTENGHDYVDLGLTSGTKWATCNIGALNPYNFGEYYAWGEIMPQESNLYDISSYRYANGSDHKFTKYCDNSTYGNNGYTDTRTVLELTDDAAHMNWGGKWIVPTKEQCDELKDECYWVWTNDYNNGSNVNGYIVYKAKSITDKGVCVEKGETPLDSYTLSDAHIFLPAAGYRASSMLQSVGTFGFYMSSSFRTGSMAGEAWMLKYSLSETLNRQFGASVRPVIPVE